VFLDVNGATLHVKVAGKRHASTIVALHGGPGISDHRGEHKGLGALTDEYKLVCYDQRGCGRSSDTPPFTNAQYVEDAEAVRLALGLGRIALYGGSYGGFIALLYALKYPDHLSHLILRDTAPNNGFVRRAKENAFANIDKAPGLTEDMLDRMFQGTIRDDADFEMIYEKILPLYWAGTARSPQGEGESIHYHYRTHNTMFSQEFSRYDVTDRLGEIRAPTLVTVGRHDWITPPEAAELMAECIPHARLVAFERSGHSPQLEANAAFVDAVRAFLDES